MKALFRMFLLAGCALAQAPPEARFAIEIQDRDGGPSTYLMLYDGPGRALRSDHRQQATLRLDYKLDGGVVRIEASVFRGKLDETADPGTIDALPWQKAGSYSAVLNQTVALLELEQFGLEPVTLNIVPAQPPVSVRPQTASNAPSVRIEIVREDRNSYTVAVHNMSHKTVKGVSIEMSGEDDRGLSKSTDTLRRLIAPGGSYQTNVGKSRSGSVESGRYVEDPPPMLMTLETAYFEDGSYEGKPGAAAMIAAHEGQQRRVKSAIAEVMADAAAGEDVKIARIRSALDQLPAEPDPQAIEDLRSRFPGLTDADMTRIRVAMKGALDVEKRSVTQTLDQLRQGTLALWWKATQER